MENKVTVDFDFNPEELLHILVYTGNEDALFDMKFRKTEIENIINEAYFTGNNSLHAELPDTVWKIIEKIWEKMNE